MNFFDRIWWAVKKVKKVFSERGIAAVFKQTFGFIKRNLSKTQWLPDVPLQQRLDFLLTRTTKKIVVYIYAEPDKISFKVRVENMCEVLNKSKEFSAVYFFVNELSAVLPHLNKIYAVVFARVPWRKELEDFIFCIKEKKIKFYFEVDDLVFDVTKTPILVKYWGKENDDMAYEGWFSHFSRICLFASLSDALITTNGFLAEQLKKLFQKYVYIVPNFLSDEQKRLSDNLWEKKIKGEFQSSKKILLGYFSGTSTHNNDFKVVSTALKEIMQENPNVYLRTTGFLKLSDELKPFLDQKRIEQLPFQSSAELRAKIAECDVNLIPLVDNVFTQCKSEIKFFEAAIVGTLSVASPMYVYKENIQDGITGYIAEESEWKAKLKLAIDNRHNVAMRDAAHAYVEKHYYGALVLEKLEKVFC